jgi:2-methylcitrate dehydratase PrpD
MGLAGPREVLEGPFGYLRLFEADHYDLGTVLGDLGRVWQVTRVSHKPFPSGRATHGAVDGVQRLRARHGFTGAEVAEVRAIVPPLIERLVGRPDVPAPAASYARLCIPFVVATTLLRGTVDVPDFTADRLTDAAVHALARRVSVVVDDNPDQNALAPQTIQVALKSGQRHEIVLPSFLGHPESPLAPAQHLDKFRRCCRYGQSPLPTARGERIIALVERLETVADVRDLIALTVP